MDESTLVSLMIGGAVALVIGGVMLLTARPSARLAEERLEGMTVPGRQRARAERSAESLLKAPPIRPEQMRWLEGVLPSVEGLRRLYEQADMDLDFGRFLWIAGGMAATGGAIGLWLLPVAVAPVGAAVLGCLPFLFLVHRKRRRMKQFLASLPEAVELMGRALRAGHGLGSGLQLVSQELKGPLADEFGRVFEEQNLGIPMDTALRGMADRVPSMDVRFLVTAIVIQRATGGDLAEVLDKIGRLVRQRFELYGHVKALTGEGRMSGVVLLALPPGLLAFLTSTNFDYVRPLFETSAGNKMLAVTAVLQVVGAIAIKKIVSIKV